MQTIAFDCCFATSRLGIKTESKNVMTPITTTNSISVMPLFLAIKNPFLTPFSVSGQHYTEIIPILQEKLGPFCQQQALISKTSFNQQNKL
jgi:hypothetical protein